jgi:hypothetical protein
VPDREIAVMVLIGGIVGIAMYLAFLGFMLWWVPALPLMIIVAVCTALLIFDLAHTLRYGEGNPRRR